jgi:NAD(P)-dependent dehydrogenase (short-subunit alcohol dehydrogenase family)
VNSLVVKADVSKAEEIRSMFKTVDKEFGKLDILFNNAGIHLATPRVHEMPLEIWEKLITINLTSVFLCMQEGLKLMLRQQKGSIINISSICGLTATRTDIMDSSAYVSAKHAVIGLTKQVAAEYAAEGIRVNALAPGFFPSRINRDIEMSDDAFQYFLEQVSKSTLMGRRGDPAELKGIAIYLASDASSFATGATFTIDGGWTAC